jgi:Domain of unknown function (DUF4926)
LKPKDLDIVKLRKPLPEHNLPAGAKGTIVNDIQTEGLPQAYLVEFADSDGVTYALVHVPEDNLDVVWRPS